MDHGTKTTTNILGKMTAHLTGLETTLDIKLLISIDRLQSDLKFTYVKPYK